MCPNVRGCSLQESCRPGMVKRSRSSSPGANTRVRICPPCWLAGRPHWVLPSRCVTRCRAICQSRCRSSWAIVSPTARRFVEVAPNFPSACRYVLEALGEIYHYDELAREQGMTPEERLRFHQAHSGPVMEALQGWLTEQLEGKKVEPNSGLGQAITYMRKHWEKLTLFLR